MVLLGRATAPPPRLLKMLDCMFGVSVVDSDPLNAEAKDVGADRSNGLPQGVATGCRRPAPG